MKSGTLTVLIAIVALVSNIFAFNKIKVIEAKAQELAQQAEQSLDTTKKLHAATVLVGREVWYFQEYNFKHLSSEPDGKGVTVDFEFPAQFPAEWMNDGLKFRFKYTEHKNPFAWTIFDGLLEVEVIR